MIANWAAAMAAFSCLLVACPRGVAAAEPSMDAALKEDFRGARCDTANWKFIDPVELTRPTAEGLAIDIPENAGGIPSAGLAARFGLRGDFEITAEFELLDVPTPKSGFGAGATISIASADGQGASLQRVNFPDKAQVYVCHRAMPQNDGKVKHVVEVVPTTATTGQVRLARRGGELSYFCKEGGAKEFQKLHQADFSNADLRFLHLAAQTGEAPNTVKLRWKEFQVRAEDLLGEDGKSLGDRRLVLWGALGIVSLLVVGMVCLKANARRNGPNSVA